MSPPRIGADRVAKGENIVRGKSALCACFAGGFLALAVGSAAAAGTVIAMDESIDGAPPQPRSMVLDTDRLRMSSALADVIFRGDLNKLWVLRSKDHSYLELTPGGMGQAAARMDKAMAQMKEKLALMPEAQRKQIEAMMAARGVGQAAPGAASQVAYEKAGDSRRVGEWNCEPYRIVTNGKLSSDVCIARLSDLGLSRDDLKAFSGFGAFIGQMTAAAGFLRMPMMTYSFDSMTKAVGFDGFPVQTSSTFGDGGRRIVVTLKSVQRQDLAADAFDVPSGYAKRDLPAIGRAEAPQ